MRIAFFGGSFDPPHLGHLRIATAAADRLKLDRILFAPAALQPLKQEQGQPGASYDERLTMVELLLNFAGDPRFVASSLDAPRRDGNPNYTYDTVTRLRAEIGLDHKVFILTGADALNTLPMWYRALDLVQHTDFIIASRPGSCSDRLSTAPYSPLLRLHTPSHVVKRASSAVNIDHLALFPYEQGAAGCESSKPANFYIMLGLAENISSTAIRDTIAVSSHLAVKGLSPQVARYIRVNGLYQKMFHVEHSTGGR